MKSATHQIDSDIRTEDPISSVGNYYPWLDALRGISWILVMIGHTTNHFYLARMGVGIFFAISGWLITKIIIGHTDSNWSLVTFYTRRCIRIIPLYYILIIMVGLTSFFLPGWKNSFEWLEPVTPEHQMLPYLFTFSTEGWRISDIGHLIGHCWSLCVEERFYVFWPLILTFWPRQPGAQKVLIALMIGIWSIALRNMPLSVMTEALWAMPFPLLLGCALAIFSPFPTQSTSKFTTIPLAVLFFTLYAYYAWYMETTLGPTINTFSFTAGVLSIGLVASAIVTAGEPNNVIFRLFREAGKLSYGAYLFHPVFAFIAIKIAYGAGYMWLSPVIGVAMLLPFAYFMHYRVEKPILSKRSMIEKSPKWRLLSTCLQIVPISIGLIFLFPWVKLKNFIVLNNSWVFASVGAISLFCAVYYSLKSNLIYMKVNPLQRTRFNKYFCSLKSIAAFCIIALIVEESVTIYGYRNTVISKANAEASEYANMLITIITQDKKLFTAQNILSKQVVEYKDWYIAQHLLASIPKNSSNYPEAQGLLTTVSAKVKEFTR